MARSRTGGLPTPGRVPRPRRPKAQRAAEQQRRRAEIEARKRERLARRTAELAKKLERKKARLRKTERRLDWQRKLALAEQRLKKARRTADVAEATRLITEADLLMKESERLRSKPGPNFIERLSSINEWRRNTTKMVPSKTLIAWCEQLGRWCTNADGTKTGEAHYNVPSRLVAWEDGNDSPREVYGAFRSWFLEILGRLSWLNEEPVFWAVGYSVGGVDQADRGRYDKIRGMTATLSYWYKPTVLDGEKTFLDIAYIWLNDVATRVLENGLRINTVSFFCHYGPTPPLRADEFSCPPDGDFREEPEPPTRKEYAVVNENNGRYLTRAAPRGYEPNLWGAKRDALPFPTRQAAQATATRLNRTCPSNRRYCAVVRPMDDTP